MKKKLESEIKALAERILKLNRNEDVSGLQYEARKLYEKLTVLKFMEDRLGDLEIDTSKSAVADRFKDLASAVLDGNTQVPETNPHDEDIITPGIDTIKGMVAEMPHEETSEVLSDLGSAPSYEKMEKEILSPAVKTETNTVEQKPVSLNDKLKKGITIGLNDKLAFIKHLFNGSAEDYNRVISQLNTFSKLEEASSFINNMVKPDYDHWTGKEAYVDRFLQIVESKFD